MLATALIALGIALLYGGGELLVTNSMHLARRFGLSPLVIGLTVVAFATSSPELAATVAAVLKDSPDMAVGNAFGSNIANLGLILGLATLIAPIPAQSRILRRDVPFMLFATILVYPLMVIGGQLDRIEGAFMFLLLVAFLFHLLKDPDDDVRLAENLDATPPRNPWLAALGVALGVGLLVGGADALVAGASQVARALGISGRVIGLTIVAFGTSLPELAASLAAVRQGQGDLVLGNLIGSNIFNLLCILGLTAVVKPILVHPQAMQLDFWVMLGTSVLVMIFLIVGRGLVRSEGATLLVLYLAYVLFLFH